ncbi:hypothetical protein ACX93W_08785 [Paenibacillus sp. CAU 1782]
MLWKNRQSLVLKQQTVKLVMEIRFILFSLKPGKITELPRLLVDCLQRSTGLHFAGGSNYQRFNVPCSFGGSESNSRTAGSCIKRGHFQHIFDTASRVQTGYDYSKTKQKAAVLEVSSAWPTHVDDVWLEIDYDGDVAQAFLGDKLLTDNIHFGQSWSIGLKSSYNQLKCLKAWRLQRSTGSKLFLNTGLLW